MEGQYTEIINNIVSAVTGGIVTAVIGGVVYWLKSRRGNHIIVQEISQSEQLEFSQNVKEDLEVFYKGEKVDNLVLSKLEITNSGDEVIEPISITVDVLPIKNGNVNFVELSTPSLDEKTKLFRKGKQKFVLRRDYLKSKKKYPSEKIEISCFSNEPVRFNFQGGGKNWDIRYKRRKYKYNLFVCISSILVIIMILVIIYFEVVANTSHFSLLIKLIGEIFTIFVMVISFIMVYQSFKSMNE